MDLIERQAAIDAMCAVCGNDCDKSEFVYNAPQDEQVILCPEHYALTQLPSAQQEAISLEWIDKHLEWLDNCDNDFAQLAKVGIRAMVELWKKDRT